MTTTTTNKDVNIFGPIGGKDYLKLNAAKRHIALNKQIPNLLGGVPGSPIPQVLPATGRKMANQMTENTRQLRQLARIVGGKAIVPASFTGDPLLKSAAEKLLSGSTTNSLRTQKSRKIAQLLRDHSNGQNDSYFRKEAALPLLPLAAGAAANLFGRLAPMAAPAARALGSRTPGLGKWVSATRGAAATAPARQAMGRTAGQTLAGAGRSAAGHATTAAAGAGLNQAAGSVLGNAAKRVTTSPIGRRAGSLWRRVSPSLGGAIYGNLLGYGADTGASMMGYETGGMGSVAGTALGFLRGSRGGALLRKLQKTDAGQEAVRTLRTLAGTGFMGEALSHNTGGLMNFTDPIGTYNRMQQRTRDNLARELGFESLDSLLQHGSEVVRGLKDRSRDGADRWLSVLAGRQ